MDHFYDGQIKRYLTQFMRMMSNFSYKDAKGRLQRIPVRYGDTNRQVAQIINQNSENVIQSAPFIACYIKSLDLARDRLQDPTFVSKLNIRERAYDEAGQEYLNVQGANYTVERLMPTPYNLTFNADIWTTNTDQKLQLLEQLLVLFNPSMEIQTSNNYIDWTSLSLLELTGLNFSSRSVPQGLEQDIDIATLTFASPIWLTTPAKVKKLGIITNIITSMFNDPVGTVEGGAYDEPNIDYFTGRVAMSVDMHTLGNMGLLVLNNTGKLLREGEGVTNSDNIVVPAKLGIDVDWQTILDLYPGKFIADLSQVRLQKPDGNEIVGFLSLDPVDAAVMHIRWDPETIYDNTSVDINGLRWDGTGTPPTGWDSASARGTVDAIVDPTTYNPRREDTSDPSGYGYPTLNTRLLILEDINTGTWAVDPSYDGPEAWRNRDGTDLVANANDIIEWNGDRWVVVVNSQATQELTYITNNRTGVQYVWDGTVWNKSFEGVYTAGKWRLVL